jgi:hypothetical protein
VAPSILVGSQKGCHKRVTGYYRSVVSNRQGVLQGS